MAAALAGVLAVGGLSVTLYRHVARWDRAQVAILDPALLALGLESMPSEPAVVPPRMRHRLALQRVPLETDRVIFYYVAALPASPPGTSSAGAERSRAPRDPDAEPNDPLVDISGEGPP